MQKTYDFMNASVPDRLTGTQLALLESTTLLTSMMCDFAKMGTPDVRTDIVQRSTIRLVSAAHSIATLSEEGFVEDIRCINRCMTEVAINAAYLMNADNKEIIDYIGEDAPKYARIALRLNSFPGLRTLTHLEELQMREFAKAPTVECWSGKTLMQRARHADSSRGTQQLMTLLATIGFQGNHSYVHGGFAAVWSASDWALEGYGDPSQRSQQLSDALTVSILVLLSFAGYICEKLELDTLEKVMEFNNRLSALGD